MSWQHAKLTNAEIKAICDPTKSYYDAVSDLDQITRQRVGPDEETDFERGVRVINTLEEYTQRAKTHPSTEILAVILNCENRLFDLNKDIEMEYKPFLSHWIETLLHLEQYLAKRQLGTITNSDQHGTITTETILRIRAEVIKSLIWDPSMRGATPLHTLQQSFLDQIVVPQFDIQKYIQILLDTEVWDKEFMAGLPDPIPQLSAEQPSEPRKSAVPQDNSSDAWRKSILQKLDAQPETAVHDLTHLPVDIPSLDFLTTILTDRTLEERSIESAPTIRSYVQHALRLVEEMGTPPPTTDQNGDSDGVEGGVPIVEYGKEAQSRAVQLLLLFIKSSIRKGLFGTEVMYYEIQEICVRYVWLKEVRDFRSWVEEGTDGEEVA